MSVFPNRKRLRYQGYDYSQLRGYFVTINTYYRIELFGQIINQDVTLNEYGFIVEKTWLDLPNHYPCIELDEFIIMPDHFHAVLFINGAEVRAGSKPAHNKQHTLPEVIRGFKTFSARNINTLRGMAGQPVWHRSYYDHIIRDNNDLDRILAYIHYDPARRRSRA